MDQVQIVLDTGLAISLFSEHLPIILRRHLFKYISRKVGKNWEMGIDNYNIIIVGHCLLCLPSQFLRLSASTYPELHVH